MARLTITNARIIDGTGAPAFHGDVVTDDGVITSVGASSGAGGRVIDAQGRVVSPGFIDVHTHYDAQLMWDPTASPSVNFGVTSVIAGNCGFGIAPCRPENVDYILRMLAGVEGMPHEALVTGLDWAWRSFPEWLERFEGRLAINAGFLVGHSALRREVLGERVHEAATDAEVATMCELLGQALAAGGLGFSTSRTQGHQDGFGDPVPSRGAGRDELVALAGVVRDYPGTMLEGIFDAGPKAHSSTELQLMIDMSLAGNRPLNWNLFSVSAARLESCRQHFENIETARRANAAIIPLTLPIPAVNRMSLYTGFLLKTVPGWERVWQRPIEQTMELFADPVKRAELNALAVQASPRYDNFVDFAAFTIIEVFCEDNRQYLGRKIGDIAAERRADPFDVLVEICLADGLRTGLLPRAIGEDDDSWKLRVDAIRDGRTIVGGSDAGAHLDLLNAFVYPAELLDGAVRQRHLLTLEQAVHLMTQSPARYAGLSNRGVIAPGMAADLIVFDPDGFNAGPVRTVPDLPGNCERLYANAEGMDHVIVNGTEVIADGRVSGDLPGRLLRSGRDTETVTPVQWNAYVSDKKIIPTKA